MNSQVRSLSVSCFLIVTSTLVDAWQLTKPSENWLSQLPLKKHCSSTRLALLVDYEGSLMESNEHRGEGRPPPPPDFTVIEDESQSVDSTSSSFFSRPPPPPDFTVIEADDGNSIESSVRRSSSRPDFTVIEDDDDYTDSRTANSRRRPTPPPDFTVINEKRSGDDHQSSSKSGSSVSSDFSIMDSCDEYSEKERSPKARTGSHVPTVRPRVRPNRAASWMDRNSDFENYAGASDKSPVSASIKKARDKTESSKSSKTFREDFRGTRLFVSGIPPGTSWQTLKDHFRVAGQVVFASVSVDAMTGAHKGEGFVQYETTEMAQHAITMMRDFPLDGHVLFVRPDLKAEKAGAKIRSRTNPNLSRDSRSPPETWKCADEENASFLEDSDRSSIMSIIKARDDARRRKRYNVADNMREELKIEYGVHLDDRLKLWWVSYDGKDVPRIIRNIKGEGRWGQAKPWRQIPTTPENDACVNPDLVSGLLAQRDIARREKDFATADALLAEARDAPDGDLTLRIHDESRTWRVWTEAPPPRPVQHDTPKPQDPAEQCIAIVQEYAPEKVDEIRSVLRNFQGREYAILKKLKKRYLV